MKNIIDMINGRYGVIGLVILVIVAIVIGAWLGYAPAQVVEWLGL